MTAFGDQLRIFRQRCQDSSSPHGRLTQEKFGELLGEKLGIGYTGAAVSDWERGKSKIYADDRLVSLAMVQVLREQGGLTTIGEANHLLAAGNFRDLDPEEIRQIFGIDIDPMHGPHSAAGLKTSKSLFSSLLGGLFSLSEEEVREWKLKIEKGPSPSWPRWLAAFLRLASDRFSISIATVLWFSIGLMAWWLVALSLRWPFASRAVAVHAIGMYVVGTLIIPLVIGLLVDTKHDEYWRGQGLADSALLRLYTYQGAAIGFNLGYFFIFPLVLFRYYLGLEASIWLEFAAVTLGLILGNMSARVVPHNLWLAYRRLRLADGAIFFVVALLGPLWGVFFLEYYSILLTPLLGSVIIIIALTISILTTVRHSKKPPTESSSLKE